MDLRTALLLVLLLPPAASPASDHEPDACARGCTRLAMPAPMLAGSFHAGIDIAGWLVSEKLDGVRARWDGRQLLTRAGNRIEAPAWFTAGWPTRPIEGELWIGRGKFQQVSDLRPRIATRCIGVAAGPLHGVRLADVAASFRQSNT